MSVSAVACACMVALAAGAPCKPSDADHGPQPAAGIHRLIEERRHADGDRLGLQARLVQASEDLEALAQASTEDSVRDVLLSRAAMGYFSAAVPFEHDPPDDPLRLQPGPAWEKYLRVAWRRVRATADGVDRLTLTRLLHPEAAFNGEVNRVGPVYGADYYAPALEVFTGSANPVVRVQAGAYAAARCILSDWGLACGISREVHELERRTPTRSLQEAQDLWSGLDEMSRAFARALWRTEGDLARALALYAEDAGGYPPPPVLSDGPGLWRLLRPHLPDAIRQGPWGWRNPDWMDLDGNRFETTPGLRITDVRWTTSGKGCRSPVLVMELLLWEDYVVGSPWPKPWSVRRADRLRGPETAEE